MRNITYMPTLIAVMALLVVELSHSSSDYTVSGVVCQAPNAITPKFGWSPDGALNKHPIDNKWAVCPVMKLNDATGLKVTVNLVNDGNTRRSVKCWLREHSQGRVIASSSGTIAINAGGFSDRMFWEGQQFSTGSSLTVQCQLPPSVIIESVRSEYLGGSGNGGSGGTNGSTDVEACLTYAKESANPGVRFNNGAVIENVRGDGYYGPDSILGPTQVVLFNAIDGQWYELRSGEIKRVSMLTEPQSCFTPNLGTIEAISEDGNYTIYSITGEADFREYGGCANWEVGDILTNEEAYNWANLSKALTCD